MSAAWKSGLKGAPAAWGGKTEGRMRRLARPRRRAYEGGWLLLAAGRGRSGHNSERHGLLAGTGAPVDFEGRRERLRRSLPAVRAVHCDGRSAPARRQEV